MRHQITNQDQPWDDQSGDCRRLQRWAAARSQLLFAFLITTAATRALTAFTRGGRSIRWLALLTPARTTANALLRLCRYLVHPAAGIADPAGSWISDGRGGGLSAHRRTCFPLDSVTHECEAHFHGTVAIYAEGSPQSTWCRLPSFTTAIWRDLTPRCRQYWRSASCEPDAIALAFAGVELPETTVGCRTPQPPASASASASAQSHSEAVESLAVDRRLLKRGRRTRDSNPDDKWSASQVTCRESGLQLARYTQAREGYPAFPAPRPGEGHLPRRCSRGFLRRGGGSVGRRSRCQRT
jgi:hypothetical protein